MHRIDLLEASAVHNFWPLTAVVSSIDRDCHPSQCFHAESDAALVNSRDVSANAKVLSPHLAVSERISIPVVALQTAAWRILARQYQDTDWREQCEFIGGFLYARRRHRFWHRRQLCRL
ncbi:hypothetical protein [Mesorhizobium sp. BH1-1-4]|uniref:hypothetical protein n=1 Tax=Mesorhizobium sp. BH1-1-4 TaxID=2876662 RepID=UPI001CD1717C|nr:hypothetical protein [Mesorhizobium sp. BH1-1-4]MBZ9996178.1 hypothetical protein [Mesorhizobium sp. BH1-1-4]